MASIEFPTTGSIKAIVELLDCDPLSVSYDSGLLSISGVDQDDLETAVATYAASPETYLFAPAREARGRVFGEQVIREIEERYSSFRRELFLALYVEAVSLGLVNRAAYVTQLLSWVKEAVSVCIQYEADLASAESIASIGSVSDGSEAIIAILEDDPEVTIKAALEILD